MAPRALAKVARDIRRCPPKSWRRRSAGRRRRWFDW